MHDNKFVTKTVVRATVFVNDLLSGIDNESIQQRPTIVKYMMTIYRILYAKKGMIGHAMARNARTTMK